MRLPALPTLRYARPVLVALLALAVVAGGAMAVRRAGRPSADALLSNALSTLAAGNYSAARRNAQAAIAAAPARGTAHAVLARAYLELDDGLAAEAELARAHDKGVPVARLHQLLAHARLLQGDIDAALMEAERASPRYAGYARRVQARALAASGKGPAAQAVLIDLIRANPDDRAAWRDLARIRLTAGDVGGAADAATRAVSGDASDPAALLLQGQIVRARYGLIASLAWFRAALKRDAYYHPALIEYAATLGDAGRYAEMLVATRAALAARPGSPQALYLQAVMATRAGRSDLARRLMQAVGGRLDGLAGVQLLGGALDYALGRDEQATIAWRRLVDAQPMNVAARRLLGAALLRSGDAQGAIDVLRPIVMRADADAYTLMLVARAAETKGDRAFAADLLDRANAGVRGASLPFASDAALSTLAAGAARAANDPTYRMGLIRGLAESDDLSDAQAQAASLTAASPGAPAAFLALGDVLVSEQRHPGASAAYARAADLSFDEQTMLRLVDALGRVRHERDAAATLALYLGQHPQSLVARRLAAATQLAGRSWDEAIETLEGVRREVGSSDAGLLIDLSHAYAGAGQADVARVYGRSAYRLHPMNAAACDAYGWALALNGDRDGARQLLRKGDALVPGDPAIAAHLARIGR